MTVRRRRGGEGGRNGTEKEIILGERKRKDGKRNGKLAKMK
jgi:hypothetical protein